MAAESSALPMNTGEGVEEDDDQVEIEEVVEESEEVKEKKEKDEQETEMEKIEEDKKNMSVVEKLDTAFYWKIEGNNFFSKGELARAADAYYHAIIYCRELTNNPKYYPNIGHSEEQQKLAREIHESSFSNLALVQYKCALPMEKTDVRKPRILEEAIKSGGEALKLNPKNVKAFFRRGQARLCLAHDSTNAEAQQLCVDAKADFSAVLAEDANNRTARAELAKVSDLYKRLRREELSKEKGSFSFASTLSALGTKEKDVLGDGSVKRVQVEKAGDGSVWMNPDWLAPASGTRCIVHISCRRLEDSTATAAAPDPVTLSFVLGDPDMHEGIAEAVKVMTLGEVAQFRILKHRLKAKTTLGRLLRASGEVTTWQITLMKFVTWADLDRDGGALQKIAEEGYGEFPRPLALCSLHWRVRSANGELLFSSRNTIHVGGDGGLQTTEDEDKDPEIHAFDTCMWAPLARMCKSLRQGGRGELRLRRMPPWPKEMADSAKVSMMIGKSKLGDEMQQCTLSLELDRVVQPADDT